MLRLSDEPLSPEEPPGGGWRGPACERGQEAVSSPETASEQSGGRWWGRGLKTAAFCLGLVLLPAAQPSAAVCQQRPTVNSVAQPAFPAVQSPGVQSPSVQSPAAQDADASAETLSYQPGQVRPGAGRRVLVTDEVGQVVVGEVHVESGRDFFVYMPDGQLTQFAQADTERTERPFVPMDADELAERLTRGSFPGFKTRQTRRYLYVYNSSDEFALATSRILETMYPGIFAYTEGMGIPVDKPRTPLVVLMFRTEGEFQRYRRMPAGVVAYYSQLSNRVIMYEESKLSRVKRELGIQQSISTIAHEGVHQILANIGVQKRLSYWPMWLSEGLAEYFAPTTVGRRLTWKGAGKVNDLRMFELEQYIKTTAVAAPQGKMIRDTVSAARLTSTGYAAAWSLTHFLAKNRKDEFAAFVKQASQAEPLGARPVTVAPGVVPDNLARFEAHFDEDLGEMERLLAIQLSKLPYQDPFADYPHYAAMLLVPDGRKVRRLSNVFHTNESAQKWSTAIIGQLPQDRRGEARVNIRRFNNRSLAENFARSWAAAN